MSSTLPQVRIERPATGGGVGRMADGRVIFVRHSLPGELVGVDVTETTANFSRGDAIEILEASPLRVTAPCPYAIPGACGGCDLQHATSEGQLLWKTALVQEHLRRIAGVDADIEVESAGVPAKGSRTRLRCAVTDEGQLALRGARSHTLVPIDSCWVASERFAPAFKNSWDSALEVELRDIGEGEPFAVVKRDTHRGTVLEFTGMRGEPLEPHTASRVEVAGHYYNVRPQSFWQSHRAAPEILLDAVMAGAQVRFGDRVTDLFSGAGLFSIPLAKAAGPKGKVVAVESNPYAVRDARENGVGFPQLKVREWSVTPRSVNDSVEPGSVVVVDPPRSGLGKGVADAILRRQPRRLVYVSCDAATFARDLKVLMNGYDVEEIRAFDLFPETEHVELVAVLDNGS
jgi:tRNA/tmRNA/rRNA uracil-C5-methylase (TrmA/RlmC/RlmD family)